MNPTEEMRLQLAIERLLTAAEVIAKIAPCVSMRASALARELELKAAKR